MTPFYARSILRWGDNCQYTFDLGFYSTAEIVMTGGSINATLNCSVWSDDHDLREFSVAYSDLF